MSYMGSFYQPLSGFMMIKASDFDIMGDNKRSNLCSYIPQNERRCMEVTTLEIGKVIRYASSLPLPTIIKALSALNEAA